MISYDSLSHLTNIRWYHMIIIRVWLLSDKIIWFWDVRCVWYLSDFFLIFVKFSFFHYQICIWFLLIIHLIIRRLLDDIRLNHMIIRRIWFLSGKIIWFLISCAREKCRISNVIIQDVQNSRFHMLAALFSHWSVLKLPARTKSSEILRSFFFFE